MQTTIAALTLTDAATTPVAHSFSPASRVVEGSNRWLDREHNSGIPIGMSSATHSIKEPSAGGVYRQKVNLAVPHLDLTVPTKPVQLGVARANVEFIFPDYMSDQQRKDVLTMFRNVLTTGSATALGDNIVAQALAY